MDFVVCLVITLLAVTSSHGVKDDPLEGVEDLLDKLGPPYMMINMEVNVYILPLLNYSSVMLEPYIDALTMDTHFYGHHNAYRVKLNDVLDKWRKEQPDNELAKKSILYLLQDPARIPLEYFSDVKNNGGGYVNHCLYWGIMSPNLEKEERVPKDYIKDDIERSFGDFDTFKEQFTGQGVNLFGSGYVWLVRNEDKSLEIHTTVNQDSPISMAKYPILVLDVWEHAYYLKHKNLRKNHIEDWWNVVDWENVSALDKWWNTVLEPKQVKEEL